MIELQHITRFHRAQESFMSFHVIENDSMKAECSIRVAELQTMFPQVVEALALNSFFSVNSFWHKGYRSRTGTIAGLPRPLRRIKYASYLNAAFVDCDAHKSGPRVRRDGRIHPLDAARGRTSPAQRLFALRSRLVGVLAARRRS